MSAFPLRMPDVGETLGGKYLIRRVLGEGGMGTVFEAEHLRLRQPVALKLLNAEMRSVDEIVKRFEREARAAATLKSRHVVRVMDVEATAEGVPYMVMELLAGMDLETLRSQRAKLPYEEVCDYVLQACDALAEAHEQGIVHRDLKPANLFLARQDDDRVIVKVLDFGISKFLADETKLTSAGAVMGTAIYMSPEQIRGESVDTRSDIWALGVILYELLAGDAPWTGPATRIAAGIVSEPAPDIRQRCTLPEELAQLIERMLAKDANARPRSIAEIASVLGRFVAAGSGGAEASERILRRAERTGSSARMLASLPSSEVGSAKTMLVGEKSTDIAATVSPAQTTKKKASTTGIVVGLAALAVVGVALGGVAITRKSRDAGATPSAGAGAGGAGAGGADVPVPIGADPAASGVATGVGSAAAAKEPSGAATGAPSEAPPEATGPAAGAGGAAATPRPAAGSAAKPAAGAGAKATATAKAPDTAGGSPVVPSGATATATGASTRPTAPAPKPTAAPRVTNPLFIDEK